jgi:hypothetical protein
MDSTIIIAVIGAITTIAGYFYGSKNRQVEASKDIFVENSQGSLISLRHVVEINERLETRLQVQDTRIAELESMVRFLMEENQELRRGCTKCGWSKNEDNSN